MILSPSICTAGYGDAAEVLDWIERRRCDRVHIDIMDGWFVDPIMGGTDYVRMIRNKCALPRELHFMTYEPEKMLDIYEVEAGELIYVHADTTQHPHRLLQSIRERGCIPGLALSVYDQPEEARELLDQTENVLLMGVKAGCPASDFHWSVLEKCTQLKEMAKTMGRKLHVQVDGSVSPENVGRLVRGGIDAVVLGYPGCFDPTRGREATLALMRQRIEEAESEITGGTS